MTDTNEDLMETIKATAEIVNQTMKPLEDAFMLYVNMCKEVGYGRMIQLLERKLNWPDREQAIRRAQAQARRDAIRECLEIVNDGNLIYDNIRALLEKEKS